MNYLCTYCRMKLDQAKLEGEDREALDRMETALLERCDNRCQFEGCGDKIRCDHTLCLSHGAC